MYATAANNRKVIQDIDCNIQHTEICPYNETYDGILFKSVFYRKSDAILSVWSALPFSVSGQPFRTMFYTVFQKKRAPFLFLL